MFSFRFLNENDLEDLRQWLSAVHVKDYWQETQEEEEFKKKFLEDLPDRAVFAFIIEKDKNKVGYIQYYDATKVGGGWWPSESKGTYGIDLMIGDPDLIGLGMGPQIINEFVEFMRGRESGLKSIIIDPSPNNKRAIRAFEKAGFIVQSEIVTPGGLALLMRRQVCE